ncbi:MAG TPA: YetF domain-containing protein [Clostridium sp.]
MDFLQAQETLTNMEWFFRAIIAFFFLLCIAKILGQRTISQLRLLDFVISLVIGNIIAHPLSDEHLALKGSIITSVTLVALYLASLFIILRFPSLRKLVNNSPIKIVQDGEILTEGLKKARISIDVLLEELREEKVEDVKKVALALWEADGKISVFLQPKYEPITPSSLQMEIEPFSFPRTIIKEGKTNSKELKQTQKDEDWIISNLKNLYQTEVKNVLLATLDNKGNLKVFLYK